MSVSKEFNASSVEEAVAKASAYLEIPADELPYEVVDEGSEGFLGLGARDARIKVDLPSESDPSKTAEPTTDRVEDAAYENNIETDAAATPERAEKMESDDPPVTEGVSSEVEIGNLDESGVEKETMASAPDWLIDEVNEYVSSVIGGMGLEARLDVYDTEEYIAVDIASDHTALVIGQKGETIDSLQYLTNSAIYRDRDFVKRIVLDSEGYRQRRIEAIQGMAHRTARKSIREGREIQMPPMNSSERRIVHMYLKENPRVTTFSEGTGSDRRITVAPS